MCVKRNYGKPSWDGKKNGNVYNAAFRLLFVRLGKGIRNMTDPPFPLLPSSRFITRYKQQFIKTFGNSRRFCLAIQHDNKERRFNHLIIIKHIKIKLNDESLASSWMWFYGLFMCCLPKRCFMRLFAFVCRKNLLLKSIVLESSIMIKTYIRTHQVLWLLKPMLMGLCMSMMGKIWEARLKYFFWKSTEKDVMFNNIKR